MKILQLTDLTKSYGKIKALDKVSFDVPEGTVFGILGPNGSGKTTLLSIVLDVLRSDGGSFKLFEEEPNAFHRKRIGSLLETPNFYHYLSARQNLEIAAEIKGRGKEGIETVLKQVNLFDRRNSPFSTFSLGMKQRLAIASALLGNPDVLLLDEPTNGLDPVGISEIRMLILDLASKGKTIIMASHLLDEVEKVCTHAVILKFGKQITSGPVSEILSNDDLVEVSSNDLDRTLSVLNQFEGLRKINKEGELLVLDFPANKADLSAINAFCFQHGVVLSHLQFRRKSLETRFLELTH
jgi:ABC-type multidrug transport system ATPase subunit